jgi:hypothetical protein
MGMKRRILITLGVGVLLVVSFFIITEKITELTGKAVSVSEDSFEKCLEEQDITLHINSEDVVETYKDIQLKDMLVNFKVFNCLRNKDVCDGVGIDSFPSWIINGEVVAKDINLNELEEYSRCKFVE